MVKEIKYMFLYVSFCLKSISPRESGEHEHTHMATFQNNHHTLVLFKGLVPPKMKILSVFTHPHVVPKLCLFVLLNTKEDIWKNVLIKQISFPIDYHSMVLNGE